MGSSSGTDDMHKNLWWDSISWSKATISSTDIAYTRNLDRKSWYSLLATSLSINSHHIAWSFIIFPGKWCRLPSTNPFLRAWSLTSTFPVLPDFDKNSLIQALHFLDEFDPFLLCCCHCLLEKAHIGSEIVHIKQIFFASFSWTNSSIPLTCAIPPGTCKYL